MEGLPVLPRHYTVTSGGYPKKEQRLSIMSMQSQWLDLVKARKRKDRLPDAIVYLDNTQIS